MKEHVGLAVFYWFRHPSDGWKIVYFGSDAVPFTLKTVSDFAWVSSGCAPPTANEYLPSRIDRLPWSSTLDNDRGSIFSVTCLLAPGVSFTRSNATRE